MKRRIVSFLGCLVGSIIVSGTALSSLQVSASDDVKVKCVDGSYLTQDEESKGYTPDSLMRGIHLMDGRCSITKAGLTRVYCYGDTTANHDVDYVAVIVYVDQYDEELDHWGQVKCWMEEAEDDYFVSTGKSVVVDRGYYYRVRADHFVRKDPDPMEETFSFTDGILVPK